jgi:hypothetical protein
MGYTVSIKGKWRWECLTGIDEHRTVCEIEVVTQNGSKKFIGIKPRLELTMENGAVRVVSRIDEKDWVLGSDYRLHIAAKEEAKHGLQNAAPARGSDGGL